jgi:transposase-like protein
VTRTCSLSSCTACSAKYCYASQWEAIRSIAVKIGCSAEALRKWLRPAEIDHGARKV